MVLERYNIGLAKSQAGFPNKFVLVLIPLLLLDLPKFIDDEVY